MTSFPIPPNPGDKVSAQLLREIIACLRRIAPVGGPGVRCHETPNGTHLIADYQSSPFASPAPGCFEIGQNDDGEDCFLNCFYMRSGCITEMEDQYLPDPTAIEYEDPDDPYFYCALKIGVNAGAAATNVITTYPTLLEMQEDQRDLTHYVIPLYKFDDKLNVLVDMRNMPTAVVAEGPL